MVALLVWHRTCDLQVAGLDHGWAPPHGGLGQATYTFVPLSPSSITWYWSRGSDALRLVTASLAESNDRLTN